MWGAQQYTAPGPLKENTTFIVEKGQGVSVIADRLSYEGIVSDPLLFRIAARATGTHTALKAGEYEFPAAISVADLLQKMEEGDVLQRRFTVPEGHTSWQIVQILDDVGELKGEIKEIPAEGSLLPETYHFMAGDKRVDKIIRMQDAMQITLDELWHNRHENIPVMSPKEAVILASIVEKETGVGGERARIAGVFMNRLTRGMKLQSDPTVIYALTDGKIKDDGMGPIGRRLLRKDLQFESPYNTYKYAGLPPGPICNPGRAALEAVMHPEKHDYIYFVADGTGGHVFAKTLKEHNRNVAAWRKVRRERAQQ